MNKIPKSVRGDLSTRQWKAMKRRELQNAMAAFNKFRLGCAYCPGYDDGVVGSIDTSFIRLKHSLSVKNWGR